MEIRPGAGVGEVDLGASRSEVEELLGAPERLHGIRAFYDDLVFDYGSGDEVELIEVPYSGDGHEATLDGVQLTYRLLEDVARDLEAAGHVGRPSDIGLDFPAGFAIWSMSSVDASEVDPSASPDDERPVVEGVSVATPAYFGFA